jgi:hypothetical protein
MRCIVVIADQVEDKVELGNDNATEGHCKEKEGREKPGNLV